jgi:lysine-ketoglutarate reductase/saccharopine dehydrogenase-like protein (TIGR00300 family)
MDLPENSPDFTHEYFQNLPDVKVHTFDREGKIPANFYSGTNYPTYIKVDGIWRLVRNQRMDGFIVFNELVLGLEEDGSEGILVDFNVFEPEQRGATEGFCYMTTEITREKPTNYEQIASILHNEKINGGHVAWVLGPAVCHSSGRKHMSWFIENGYVHSILGGNAVAVHDCEASLLGTSLGMDPDGRPARHGHRKHLDLMVAVHNGGGIYSAVHSGIIRDGIMYSAVKHGIPFVLCGSIRDDGPLREVISDSQLGQDAMREQIKKATAVVMIATALHSIAAGNLLPCFFLKNNRIEPVTTICVDQTEFVPNKLIDRGTHQTHGIVTNAQDFLAVLKMKLDNRA